MCKHFDFHEMSTTKKFNRELMEFRYFCLLLAHHVPHNWKDSYTLIELPIFINYMILKEILL